MSNLISSIVNKVSKAARIGTESIGSLLPPPQVRELHTLRDIHRNLFRIHFSNPPKTVLGWSSERELRTLYALGRYCRGPILEIGAWLGRSTISIARGIIDSKEDKEFTTCELNPTMENFRPVDGDSIGFYYPPESKESMGVASREVFETEIRPIITHPLGVLGQLKANLDAHHVSERVSIAVGDFRNTEPRPYKFIFSDAMHDEMEIQRNAKDLLKYLAPGSVLACHDTSPANEILLRKYFRYSYSFRADSLFIGEIASPDQV